MISAIILAGGASLRMGTPKALLRYGEKTFLQHITDELFLAGVTSVIAVVGADAPTILQKSDPYSGTFIHNPEWEYGQLSSVISGIRIIGKMNVEAVCICPVDVPFVTASMISGMVTLLRTRNALLVVPSYDKKRGHPLLISSKLFAEIAHLPVNSSVRALFARHPSDIVDYPTENDKCLVDIDTPEDYDYYMHV